MLLGRQLVAKEESLAFLGEGHVILLKSQAGDVWGYRQHLSGFPSVLLRRLQFAHRITPIDLGELMQCLLLLLD